MFRVALPVLMAGFAAPAAHGQEPPDEALTVNTIRLRADAPRPRATLEVVAWLAGGLWQGEGLGGSTQESWSPPAAGAMMGMFRLLRRSDGGRDEVRFYEFLMLAEEQGSLALKLKHFNSDFTGWEEKDKFVTFRLARLTPESIYFDGLTFRRDGPDRMTIFLALRDSSGAISEATFRYQRR